jgi:hypothetical protein
VVGVARNISGFSASNLARDAAEGVPNRIGTAIFMRCAFDLVTAGSETQYATTKRPPKRYIVAGYLGPLGSGEGPGSNEPCCCKSPQEIFRQVRLRHGGFVVKQ